MLFFVVRLKELVHEKQSGCLYFVFEYCGGGNLYSLIKTHGGGLPEELVKTLMCVRSPPCVVSLYMRACVQVSSV